ncbi:MAG: TetR/AcrR family transcriptional regulator [Spirochaetaceae bacterium]|nr:TetR/AcrR family transcriptional regulator [Spirochaetaceae bacterium]
MVNNSEKYDRIISNASLLFAQADFQSVCMEDVAIAAKVGKGTLYNYFKSKEDLYFSILHYRMEKLLLVLENAYNGRDDFLKNMRSLIIHLNKFFNNNRSFHQIWIREENSLERNGNQTILELKERILSLIENVLRQGAQEKLLADDLDTAFAAQIVYSLINYTNYEGNPDKLFSILLRGIGKDGLNISFEYESCNHENRS